MISLLKLISYAYQTKGFSSGIVRWPGLCFRPSSVREGMHYSHRVHCLPPSPPPPKHLLPKWASIWRGRWPLFLSIYCSNAIFFVYYVIIITQKADYLLINSSICKRFGGTEIQIWKTAMNNCVWCIRNNFFLYLYQLRDSGLVISPESNKANITNTIGREDEDRFILLIKKS